MPLFKCIQKAFWLFCTISLFSTFFVSVAWAEVVLDGTLGQKGAVSGPNYVITDKMGSQAGSNLFHSFQTFNINTGESGTFTGPNSVQNVIGRVTGGTSSMIDGRLGCSIPGANLFLINPYGMMFGPNATLDVNGSFHASTADYLLLGDAGRFDAVHPGQSVLTVDPPSAFGFLDDTAAPITVQGSYLKVPDGETLSLVGGDVTMIGGSLVSKGGLINLTSVASKGEAGFDNQGRVGDVHSFDELGNLSMTENAQLNTDGPGNSSVFIRGGRFVIDNSTISAKTQLGGRGGTVDIALTEDLTVQNRGVITTKVENGEKGADIHIDVNNLSLLDGGIIAANTEFQGDGGDVRVNARESVTISGINRDFMSCFTLQSYDSTGDAGHLEINTPDLHITDGGHIFGSSAGLYEGRGADITINVGSLEITGGGGIAVGNMGGPGGGGNIIINASESISISGKRGDLTSAVSTESLGEGDGGRMEIHTPELTVTDGGAISGIAASSGDGGQIDIHADRLQITDGGYISTKAKGSGKGGALTIAATDSILVSGKKNGFDSAIDVSNEGEGDGGSLAISSGKIVITNEATIRGVNSGSGSGGKITLQTARLDISAGGDINCSTRGSGRGGDLTIVATESISIWGKQGKYDSGIYSNAFSEGNAGQVAVSTPSLSISDSAAINVVTLGSGGSATVTVNAETVSLTDGGRITASTKGLGRAGNIKIDAADTVYIRGEGSGVFSTTSGEEKGGDIAIFAGALIVENHGTIDSSSKKGQNSGGKGKGNAGSISVSASEIRLSGSKSQISTSTEGSGRGGPIQLNAADIYLTGDSVIKAESTGLGNAGNIDIVSTGLLSINNAGIVTRAESAAGGNIKISGKDIQLTHGGAINASVALGTGGGGDVMIDATTLVLLEKSNITANADLGYGGNITINADAVFRSEDSYITASSNKEGQDGRIIVNSPVQDIVNSMVPLRESFLSADELLPERCETRDPEQVGSFVVDGGEGLPPRPDELLD